MAVFKSLTFDGINSLDYGIYITGEAVYNAPERAVEMVTIPGRNGALAIDQGYFENIEVSYPCGCFAETQADFAEKVSAFRNAIGSRYSYKRLTDEYNTDEYRLGLYKSGLEVSAVRYGTAGQFTITFDCKPQRFLLDGDAELSPTDYSDVQTVSGDIVQIDNDGSLGVKSVLTTIEPIQDLHGYDKPWSGGNGANKWDEEWEQGIYDSTNGQKATGSGFIRCKNKIPVLPNTAYYYKQDSAYGEFGRFCFYDADENFVGYDSGRAYVNNALTTPSNAYYITFYVSGTAYSNGIAINYPSTVTAYSPYSNICPISGHTECVTSVSGVNVWDEEWERAVINWATFKFTPSATGGRLASKNYIRVEPNQVYYANFDRTNTVLCGYSDNEGNNGRSIAVNASNHLFTVPSDCHYLKFGVNTTNYGTVYKNDMSINYPSTNTGYHAYAGHTYTTNLGRTVYGGSLDVVSGVLTVTDANIASYNGETLPSTWISDRDVYSSGTTPTTGAQVVYKLSTPQTYQLTPQEVELLLGTNNVWTDCGETSVEYGIPPYYNPTEFDARPLIKITGSGNVAIGSQLISVTDIPNTTTVYIDCDTMEIYTLSGGIPSGASSHVSFNGNDFPVLPSGLSNVTYTTRGVSIAPRWWRI